jgi:UDP-glucose:(heptosyl)LPS alpha-1,3-glucosyltransferase
VNPPPRRLRIAVLSRNFATHGGGAERYAVATVEQLASRHEVHVFAQAIEHDYPGVAYHRVPSINKPRWLNQLLFAARTAKHTRTGFDIVHSHENGWAGQVQTVHVRPMRCNLFAPTTALGRLKQWLKIITSLRLMTYLRLEAARFRPCVSWGEERTPTGSATSAPNRQVQRAIAVVSETLREEMLTSYPASRACLHTLAPGVVVPENLPTQNSARQALGLPQDGVLLLFVANDYRRKGLDTLLAALADLTPSPLAGQAPSGTVLDCAASPKGVGQESPTSMGWGEGAEPDQVHLMVVGNSAQAAEYQARCRTLGLGDRVHFLGQQQDMRPVYAAADMLVHPTHEDTFGMVVLEAMAQGLPVVVSRAPYCGLSADLGADDAVLLHDPESVKELTAALRALLGDDARRAVLAQAGRAVAARYDWTQVAQAYERLYFDLLVRP